MFVAGAVVIAAIANSYLAGALESHLESKYEEVFDSKIHASVLILGSSRAVHGINPCLFPAEMGAVYNFAVNGANPKYMLDWYVQVLRPHYRPASVAILNVDWFGFDPDWLIRALEQDSEWFPRDLALALARNRDFSAARLLKNRVPVYKNRALLLPALLGRQYGTMAIADSCQGFVPLKPGRNLGDDRLAAARALGEIDPARVEALESLVGLLRDDGAQVVFVSTPDYRGTPASPAVDAASAMIREIVARLEVPFLDYNAELFSELNLDESLFADRTHLRAAGAAAFTRRLVEDLRATLALAP